jgi:iron(III) transport system permease protein
LAPRSALPTLSRPILGGRRASSGLPDHPLAPAGEEISLSRGAPAVVAWVVVAGLVVYPMAELLAASFSFGDRVGLGAYWQAITATGLLAATAHSLLVAGVSTLAATIIGALLAYCLNALDMPLLGLWRMLVLLPYLVPPFIGAIAWVELLGPAGYLNRLLMGWFNLASPPLSIYGAGGIIFVLALHNYPLVYLALAGSIGQLDLTFQEAGQIAGARPWHVLRTISLPLLLPALLSGALLAFVTALADFGIPAILGFSRSYYVLTTLLFRELQNFSDPNNLSVGAALSFFLVAITVVVLLVQSRVLAGREFSSATSRATGLAAPHSRSARRTAVGLVALVALVADAAPLAAIFLTSVTRAWGLAPAISNWTLGNFQYVLFTLPITVRSIRNSFLLAVLAGILAVALGVLIAFCGQRLRRWGGRWLDLVAAAPYSLPGTVVALAFILAFARPIPILGWNLYNTFWILLIAYVARYLAFGVRTVAAGLTQVHASLEEAAASAGARASKRARDVLLPLLRPSMAAGFFLVFMPCLRELTVSILLWSQGNETVGVALFSLQDEGNITAAAALSLVVVAFVLVGQALGRKVAGRGLAF